MVWHCKVFKVDKGLEGGDDLGGFGCLGQVGVLKMRGGRKNFSWDYFVVCQWFEGVAARESEDLVINSIVFNFVLSNI